MDILLLLHLYSSCFQINSDLNIFFLTVKGIDWKRSRLFICCVLIWLYPVSPELEFTGYILYATEMKKKIEARS